MNAGQTGDCAAFDFYAGPPDFETIPGCPMALGEVGEVSAGANSFWMTTAPPGITINQAWTANPDVAASGISDGFVVGDFWENSSGVYGGSTLASGQQWFNTALEGSSNINSQNYGIQLVCTHSSSQGPCAGTPYVTIGGVELEGTENTGPSVTGVGSLWSAPSGTWVWNPPADDWAVTMEASDVSGACRHVRRASETSRCRVPRSRETTRRGSSARTQRHGASKSTPIPTCRPAAPCRSSCTP